MPTRSCVVCKKRDEKKNLIRIVSIEGKAIIDKNQKKKINIKSNIDMESIEKALNDIK